MTARSYRSLRNDYLNALSSLLKEGKENTIQFDSLIKELERMSINRKEAIHLASENEKMSNHIIFSSELSEYKN